MVAEEVEGAAVWKQSVLANVMLDLLAAYSECPKKITY